MMANALMHSMGISSMPSRDAGPTISYGPFSRRPSNMSVRSDASHASTERDAPYPPTELDAESDKDQLGRFEGDISVAKMAVKPGRSRRKDPTSESDPTAEPEPVVPKPKRKDRKRRAAKAKVKAVAAANAPITKRPAAATIAKRPAAAPAKFDKFNIDDWMEKNASRAEAKRETIRRYFTSRVHHRLDSATKGMPEAAVLKLQELVRGKAGKIYDSVHNLG